MKNLPKDLIAFLESNFTLKGGRVGIDKKDKNIDSKFNNNRNDKIIESRFNNSLESNNLSPTHRPTLLTITPIKVEISSDGTKKYLFQTSDNLTFESVFLKMKDKTRDKAGKIIKGEKYTFCLSSQVGCSVGCAFCSTAKGGFVRNLSSGEIVQQVLLLKKDNNLDANKSVNLVFMGMGEPLLNLKNVANAIKILSCKDGLNIAPRRQTISTSGIAPQIEKLGAMELGVQIALSLHAVNDNLRSELIPMNRVYNIAKVLESLKKFPLKSRNRILFEYLVLKGKNDDLDSAKALVKLLNGFKAKVNLIPFNPHENSEFERPDSKSLEAFASFLCERGITATIRESKGLDISAACGQLREKTLKNK
ncbi:23S rRNA (adenine(2503)-C(2))-methyltransferase RlmN [Helicobacter saguini]|uniref:23S rRNA (Adenine(2503)-C(2))-methyltransferase RlmN n=2 Tax=Helicobacter saguini TaxID=1548018 RepID=A0A347W7D2_9HELI|nr:23S rRNA (adenine(2503)-C(2))-methyltransferase RlmN [Helicobacter saguini]MWV67919.1 23S rRNA (adenine(2503)-C(2))-methyltransferase RlmN [Helicobacter saguini]MWV70613.1 23S rRNA (adenine(2503)-C(2))-methyltransferase RlmN [Helicobacter saguini]MWV72518.1 23S rRNA (adenine(2503)-C(2))-methyltransferase RlmN [Helicobacter saguini]TLD94828.1 23S rRNA (adenine(2503)-C(2))-methyltransferase RlmN [Helicobacter saguini]